MCAQHTPLDPHTRLLNSGQQQHVMPTKRLRPLDESTLRKLDEINRVYDRMEITLKELELVIKQKNERIYRRRRTLAGGCILAGLGIYLKRRFSGREKDKKE
uniref:Uncharacterized protein n=1 Tax=Leersia perrieri TaxID=77586 RepID=A0A0D9X8C6_9ORYZ